MEIEDQGATRLRAGALIRFTELSQAELKAGNGALRTHLRAWRM